MKENSYPGKLIVIEGLDGSGHSTQAGLLKNYLQKIGKKVILTREPTLDSVAGRKIRQVLDKKIKISAKELQRLFAKDRQEHLKNKVIPALKADKIVVSDRYFFSSFAYGVSDGLDLNWLIKINDKFLLPDDSFILKVRPKICLKRIEGRGSAKTLFEKEKKLAEVWQTYKILPKMFKNVKIINGEQLIESVFKNIRKSIRI